jgi:hypothetical protein
MIQLKGTTGTYCQTVINVCLSQPCGFNSYCIQPSVNIYSWYVKIYYFWIKNKYQ